MNVPRGNIADKPASFSKNVPAAKPTETTANPPLPCLVAAQVEPIPKPEPQPELKPEPELEPEPEPEPEQLHLAPPPGFQVPNQLPTMLASVLRSRNRSNYTFFGSGSSSGSGKSSIKVFS